ncbi:MAG: hypothetical protein U1A26_00035 [Candidatus Sungbacteria bacterium]|nr:hypothetical protein [Candidatus Sungbacteria bacterium]
MPKDDVVSCNIIMEHREGYLMMILTTRGFGRYASIASIPSLEAIIGGLDTIIASQCSRSRRLTVNNIIKIACADVLMTLSLPEGGGSSLDEPSDGILGLSPRETLLR